MMKAKQIKINSARMIPYVAFFINPRQIDAENKRSWNANNIFFIVKLFLIKIYESGFPLEEI